MAKCNVKYLELIAKVEIALNEFRELIEFEEPKMEISSREAKIKTTLQFLESYPSRIKMMENMVIRRCVATL
jgi:hypothetical protein